MTPRILAVLSMFFLLNACAPDQKQPTLLGEELPGLGDLDNISGEDKANAAWWDKYYGH